MGKIPLTIRRVTGLRGVGNSLPGRERNIEWYMKMIWRIAAVALLAVSLAAGIRLDWKYPPMPATSFYQVAERFEQAPAGTVAELPLQPPGWKMTLVKRS